MKRSMLPRLVLGLILLSGRALPADGPVSGVPGAVNLDQDWHLWLDPQAAWRDDVLYLPEEVDLAKMPVNPPTGGWSVLEGTPGIPVTLPATVEQYFWGKPPSEHPDPKTPVDIANEESPYLGVSWWYRTFTAPALQPGERVLVSFPGARMRAEIYVNGKLTGYNLITELPFSADITDALRPGSNQLAVRITNPGGNFNWVDFTLINWGKYQIPISHGFGGLAGGVTMQVRAPVSVSDLAVLDTPELRTVRITAELKSTGPAYDGPLRLSIKKDGAGVWNKTVDVHVPAQGAASISTEATVPNAELWDIGHPALYAAEAGLPATAHAARTTVFGFRWFTATGVGDDAQLRLNGRRVVIRSAISWGYWSPNGMFPDADAAQREVAAVHAIGLDCVQNHRHMPKEVVLDAFDRAGIFRYCEPGAGNFCFENGTAPQPSTPGPVDTSGAGGEPTTFYNRYELAKVLGMVKAFRSHPSVLVWTLQNETQPDLHNPKLFRTLREMHALDPSRIVLLKSGTGYSDQVWALPYSDEFMHDDGTGNSGWFDEHSAGVPSNVYLEESYRSPTEFRYRTTDRKEIVAWGEIATGASPDNHAAMVKWYADHGGSGYDLAVHQTLQAAYDQFLDHYHFRAAFPTTDVLFRALAAKHYFNAARMMENGRICDLNDYIVLSGWESTTLDNHSGLVDALREPKTDPTPIREACASQLLVVRPRHLVIAKGDAALLDIYLVNEANLHGSFQLSVEATAEGGKSLFHASFPVTAAGGATFAQLLQDGVSFTPTEAGSIQVTASLLRADDSTPVLTKSAQILAIDPAPAPIGKSVACAGGSDGLATALRQLGVRAVPFAENGAYDDIIVDSSCHWKSYGAGDVIQNTDKPGLYGTQFFGDANMAAVCEGLAPGPLQVELFFAEGYWDQAGQRVFDVALNGETVLKDFDIWKEAGGKNRALVKTFTVASPDGSLVLTIPHVAKDHASLAALRITDSKGRIVRKVFRDRFYQDGNLRWEPVGPVGFDDWKNLLVSALPAVKNGSRLVLLTGGGEDATRVSEALAGAGLLDYHGRVGPSDAPWFGSWYFGKKHWLLDGLPADGALDWPYQIEDGSGPPADGLLIDAPALDAVVGYGRDHTPNIGIGAAVLPVGRGQIVLLALSGLADSFVEGKADGFDPVTAKRILDNALR